MQIEKVNYIKNLLISFWWLHGWRKFLCRNIIYRKDISPKYSINKKNA